MFIDTGEEEIRMIDLICFVAYIFILVLAYLFANVSPTILTIFSCILGYVYSAIINPTKKISNIKKKMKESKITIKSTLPTAIVIIISFGSCSALFIFLANLINRWYGESFESIMVSTIFTMISLSMIPLCTICVIKMVKEKIYNLSKKDDTKWEEVSNDK